MKLATFAGSPQDTARSLRHDPGCFSRSALTATSRNLTLEKATASHQLIQDELAYESLDLHLYTSRFSVRLRVY